MRLRPDRTPQVVRRLRVATGDAGTVYVVHPGALDAAVHQSLAEALPDGAGLTVLDLSALPEYWQAALTGGHAATTVEELAGRLATELTAALDEHPYSLAGWSFGGVIAQSLVEQLPADRRPRRLVLLDSIAPTDVYKPSDDELDPTLLLGWFALYLGAKRGAPVTPDAERLAGASIEDGLPVVLEAAVTSGALKADTPIFGLRKLYDTYVDGLLRNNRLTAPYQAAPSSVPLVLVTAEGSLIPDDPTLGWEPLAPLGLTTHRSPGDHYTMLSRPDAAAVIAQLVHAT
ncbi:thioesterase domain-containing protein [Streptomyces sp. NBC_00503]|uniref:thioesterase domain-containing protein n=1 Tax=Streptomyces sp. NBC_00503 TaxID=2903659 RepID=UPI002E80AB6B|nr:thioesterase domain-containing protein [Streptomyces sp. NBC_00503]WUD86560.1 thioesterase domain-containing protein [Streptomyces sp. NBC_00503]